MLRRFWCLFAGSQIFFGILISQLMVAHATYYAAGGDANRIAVAIDGRITEDAKTGQTAFDDHHCKILPLSDKTIFFSRGTNGLIINGHTIFDADEIAQRVYKDNPTASFDEWSSQWASIMMENYRSHSSQLVIRSNPLIEGYFAGSNTNGAFGIYGQLIIGTPDEPSAEPFDHPMTGDTRFGMASSADILREFGAGGAVTDWAKTARQLLDLETRGKSPTVSLALRYETMVMVAGQSGNSYIGGETAVMMMERSDPIWRWFHRPPYCPRTFGQSIPGD
jgi:hypothetical protein